MVRIQREREEYTHGAPNKREHRDGHVKVVDAPSAVACSVDVAAEYEAVQTPSYDEGDAYSSRCQREDCVRGRCHACSWCC